MCLLPFLSKPGSWTKKAVCNIERERENQKQKSESGAEIRAGQRDPIILFLFLLKPLIHQKHQNPYNARPSEV